MNRDRQRCVLITRPQEDAEVFADSLLRRGITALLAPMMETEFLAADIEAHLVGAQAVLFTSRNGVRSFSRVSDRRDVPVFAVGDSTAALATSKGFRAVESAGGDSTDLARLVIERLSPGEGPIVHVTGKTVAGDLSGSLSTEGFKVVRCMLYEAKPIPVLSAETRAAIQNKEIDYVLFFSPRTAIVFRDLVAAAGLSSNCRKLEAICLSEAVAAELPISDWKARRTAHEPTTASLLRIMDEAIGSRDSGIETNPEKDPDAIDLAPLRRAIERATTGAEAQVESALSSPPAFEPGTDQMAVGDSVDPQTPTDDDDTPRTENNMTAKPAPKQERPTSDKKVSEPSSATTEIRSKVRAVVWTLVVVFSMAFAAYFTLPMWRGELPKYVQNQLAGGYGATVLAESRLPAELIALQNQNDLLKKTVSDLEKSVEASRGRLNAIDKIAVRQSAGEKGLKKLQAEVRSIEQTYAPLIDPQLLGRIDALEKSISGTVAIQSGQAFAGQKLDENVVALTTRIDALEAAVIKLKKASRTSVSGGSLALAAGQLRDALSRSGPFEAEIATLKRFAGDNAEVVTAIASIENMAAKGVPSRAALLSRLPMVVDIIVAATRAPEDGDWVERTVSKLRGFAIVRRVDGKGEDTDSVIARAEAAADRGDLAAAASEIAKLNKNAGDETKVWLEESRARLAVEEARAALNRFVLNELAVPG